MVSATEQQSDGFISMQTLLKLFPLFGIVIIAYYGKIGVVRAVYLVTSMEVVIWVGVFIGKSIGDHPPRWLPWIVLMYVPLLIVFSFYSLRVYEKLEKKRRANDREE